MLSARVTSVTCGSGTVSALGPFLEEGWLVHEGSRLRLTRPGMLMANEVMAVFV